MSIKRLERSDVEVATLVANPRRNYASSSLGVTGSVNLTVRSEFPTIRDIQNSTTFADSKYVDDNYGSAVHSALSSMIAFSVTPALSKSLGSLVESYMNSIHKVTASLRQTKKVAINRFVPTGKVDTSLTKKLMIKDTFNSFYRPFRPHCNWAYTDYHCLSFFTSSAVPASSALIYPNVQLAPSTAHASGVYDFTGPFSIEAHINPRFRGFKSNDQFKAGTILHLSSSYALSLITGSLKDENGRPEGFRLLLQLSRSADVEPSLAAVGQGYPNDLVFASEDNSLRWNTWHHVVVRWGTSAVDFGTGSFIIDGVQRGTFVVPSASLVLSSTTPPALVVGNYYEGTNSGVNSQALFFAAEPAERDGVAQLVPTTGVDAPGAYAFNHPLNADVHCLALHRKFLTMNSIREKISSGPTYVGEGSGYAFFLPPFFDEEAPLRKFVGTHGGVLQTPFYELDSTTREPFNAAMAFGVLGHEINLENFVKDWANDNHPLLHHMTGIAISSTTTSASADTFLYSQPFVCRKNTLIMPCDDGSFVPGYDLLSSGSAGRSRRVDDLGARELSYINIDNLVPSSSLYIGDSVGISSGSALFVNSVIGPTPEQPALDVGSAWNFFKKGVLAKVSAGKKPSVDDGPPLASFSTTKDPSSSQVVLFDVSNIYYGSRIKPRSLYITDTSLTGSGGALSIILRDDGAGNLYRANAKGTHATWASVGNVYYDEGIVLVKSPHLFGFGKDQHALSFCGERPVYVVKFDLIAPAGELNYSNNPTYKKLPPSSYPNDPDDQYVYISNVNIHDEDYNIIVRAKLAQPIMKRVGDQIGVRAQIDF